MGIVRGRAPPPPGSEISTSLPGLGPSSLPTPCFSLHERTEQEARMVSRRSGVRGAPRSLPGTSARPGSAAENTSCGFIRHGAVSRRAACRRRPCGPSCAEACADRDVTRPGKLTRHRTCRFRLRLRLKGPSQDPSTGMSPTAPPPRQRGHGRAGGSGPNHGHRPARAAPHGECRRRTPSAERSVCPGQRAKPSMATKPFHP